MKFGFFIVLMLGAAIVNADTPAPASCKPVAVKEESVMLSAKKPLLILIHNLSKSDLWITHPVSEPSASAGWSSRLQAGHWSALALDKESFEISCIESKPGHEQQVPCAGVISVCRWSVTMPAQTSGTFWAGEDMSLQALTEYLGGRGFELPDSSQ
ncbi:Uncharacterised protein [Legionella lansingensis]|uniref:Enhanced entry protein EnhB n=1 Tax=Legionella lansingensis TaxID=45067 RepID=A0A0W0VRI8_9GAMM|nr:hypothetical protein [Legionella lansingensis]KTD22770.1 hypothetical protein Llan_1121 [Legionella lansingensis]SNV57083.1 Uncharacterised protein [Legionella lansingensis]